MRELTLGRHPERNLEDARRLARKERVLVDEGVDPQAKRRKEKPALSRAKSFEELATDYMLRAAPDVADDPGRSAPIPQEGRPAAPRKSPDRRGERGGDCPHGRTGLQAVRHRGQASLSDHFGDFLARAHQAPGEVQSMRWPQAQGDPGQEQAGAGEGQPAKQHEGSPILLGRTHLQVWAGLAPWSTSPRSGTAARCPPQAAPDDSRTHTPPPAATPVPVSGAA
jgi:Arm DNA-binding domain